MTSLELKNKLARYHLLDLHRLVVVTESSTFSNADLISITSALFSQEFEIKISVADLRREAVAIQMALNRRDASRAVTMSKFSFTKLYKHIEYLGVRTPRYRAIPNDFSFFVPEELEEEARKAVKGTPYGVCLLSKSIERENIWGVYRHIESFYWAVRPRRLHMRKIDNELLRKMIRRVSVENYSLREKLIEARTTLPQQTAP